MMEALEDRLLLAVVFGKQFGPDTIGPGSHSVLTFNLTNDDLATPVSDIAFTDNLPAGVSIADPALASADCTGTLSVADGGSTISFQDGRLGAGESCSITVNVTSDVLGSHTNTTSDLTSSAGNSSGASTTLTVSADRPGFSKSFSPPSIAPGQVSTLTFTIDNTANSEAVTNLVFTDQLPPGMVVATPANVTSDCEAIPSPSFTAEPGSNTISNFFGGSVDAGASCSIQVDVTADKAGTYANVSGDLIVGSGTVLNGGFASAELEVELQDLVMKFTDDPAAPGDAVTVEFVVTNFSRDEPISDIAFTYDLEAALPGLVATSLPAGGFCGPGSQISGTSELTISGGSLDAGASCTFEVTLGVPAAATPGSYPNATSDVTYDRGGRTVTGNSASDVLLVSAAPQLTMEFTTEPVVAGSTVDVKFTIANPSQTSSADEIAFEYVIDPEFPGAVSLPADGFCGAGSNITFVAATMFDPAKLQFTGASLAAGGTCSFDVTLDVAADLPPGMLTSATGPITAMVNGRTVMGTPASDDLLVVNAPQLSKSFIDDPVPAGEMATLEFTLTYSENAPGDATEISFTDDLGAALDGLVAVGLPLSDVCGEGSALSGTDVITLSGGSLTPGSACSFTIDVAIPSDAAPGAYANTTSDVTASVLELSTFSAPAADTLDVMAVEFTKSFVDDPVQAGNAVTLEYVITNHRSTDAVTDIAFTDDLGEIVPGLVATVLPADGFCGPGSQLTGNSLLTMTGGSLAAGQSCMFSVTLAVPPDAAQGEYASSTSELTAMLGVEQLMVGPASDSLQIIVPLDFGDAPENIESSSLLLQYPTFLDSNGARHSIVDGGPFIGPTSPDADDDGQPDVSASGDDNDGGDDEDGLEQDSIVLVPGESYRLFIRQGGAGTLSAWFDFNRNSSWDDVGEQVITNLEMGDSGSVQTVDIDVPVDAIPGPTYARFRISTEADLGPTGPAVDGEVEDHRFLISDLDFGDAPTSQQSGFAGSYPTELPTGARHTPSSLVLGSTVDDEADGQPTADADGDGGDEDGVLFVTSAIATTASANTASVLVTASLPGKLDAWIDFTRDGDWDDAGEKLFAGSVDLVAGPNLVSYTIPAGTRPGDTYARFRLSSAGTDDPGGPAADGEVEDYRITILDGDAPVPAVIDLIVGTVAVFADASHVTMEHDGQEIFRVPGSALASHAFVGTGGDDELRLGDLTTAVSSPLALIFDGEDGSDTITLTGRDQLLDLTDTSRNSLSSIEIIDIVGASPNSLTLDGASVSAVTDSSDTLLVIHDEDDTVDYSGSGWNVDQPIFVDGGQRHVLLNGAARVETINTRPFQNPLLAADVNHSEDATGLDALLIINFIGRFEVNVIDLLAPTSAAELPEQYFDVNGSETATALDALNVINFLGILANSENELVVSRQPFQPIAPPDTSDTSVTLKKSTRPTLDHPSPEVIHDAVLKAFSYLPPRGAENLAELPDDFVQIAWTFGDDERSVWQIALEELLTDDHWTPLTHKARMANR